MADPAPAPQAKPAAPARDADPAGIASTVMKQQGEARKETNAAVQARLQEEVDAIDGLPSAAAGE